MKPEDYPKRAPLGTQQLLARAERAGTHTGALCQAIYRQEGELGVRRVLGVPALAKKFGLVEEACTAALELQVDEYRFVRRYLERHQLRRSTGIHFWRCTLDGVISDDQEAHHHHAVPASVQISAFLNACRHSCLRRRERTVPT